MSMIPDSLVQKMYRKESLKIIDGKLQFGVKNGMAKGHVIKIDNFVVDNQKINLNQGSIINDSEEINMSTITSENPYQFPVNKTLIISVPAGAIDKDKEVHSVSVDIITKQFGKLHLSLEDKLN